MPEKLTEEEKDYYTLTRKVWALLAPFYDVFASPFLSGMRDRVVSFTNAQKGYKVFDVATDLPLEKNIFDVSFVSFALYEMPLSIGEKVLKEMVRVTKPKGIIEIVDYDLLKNRISKFLIYHFVAIYEPEYYKKFVKSDLEALLNKNGIDNREEYCIARGWKNIEREEQQAVVLFA